MVAGELASWNDGGAKQSIASFVERVTRAGGADFVAPEARVAVFDNDGTLWCEKPMPVQADFLFRRLGEMVARDASLRAHQPWKAVVERDYQWLGDAMTKHYRGDDSDLKVMAAGLLQAYGDTSIEEYAEMARAFLRTARHPKLERPYPAAVHADGRAALHYLTAQRTPSTSSPAAAATSCAPSPGLLRHSVEGASSGSGVVLRLRDAGTSVTLVHSLSWSSSTTGR